MTPDDLLRVAEIVRTACANLSPNGLEVSGLDAPHEVWKKYSVGIFNLDLPALLAENNAVPQTMHEKYGDGSEHIACPKCGLCITCKDCHCAAPDLITRHPAPTAAVPNVASPGKTVTTENEIIAGGVDFIMGPRGDEGTRIKRHPFSTNNEVAVSEGWLPESAPTGGPAGELVEPFWWWASGSVARHDPSRDYQVVEKADYDKLATALQQAEQGREDGELAALRRFYAAWREIKEYGGRYTMDMAEAEEEIDAARKANR